MTLKQILEQLVKEGGAIVSSNDCSEMELVNARAGGRFAVDDGLGFVLRTKKWLELQLAREKAHPNTDGRYSENKAISQSHEN